MGNRDKALSLVKGLTSDVKSTDAELLSLIDLVSDEIMVETRIVKKLYQGSLFSSVEFYDLKSNATLQDKFETGVSSIEISQPTATNLDVLNIMKGSVKLAKPTMVSHTELVNNQINFVAIDDIFTDKMQSIMDKFEIVSGHRYCVPDLSFRQANDDMVFWYIASIVTTLDNIDEEMVASFMPVIIQGVKFYLYNDPVTKGSDQANNFHAMRYFRAKENLMNMYPQKLTIKRRAPRWL